MPRFLLPLKSYKTWVFIGYALLMLSISSLTDRQLPSVRFLAQNDKLVHFMEYLIFGFLLMNAMDYNGHSRKLTLIAFTIILIFPVMDESLQYFTPGRFPELADGAMDILGGFFGAFIFFQGKNVTITSH